MTNSAYLQSGNFRPGFAKTTELLASELFDAQRRALAGSKQKPKLVAFSDSRQDAAKAALNIERRHHEDFQREMLIRCLIEAKKIRRSTEEIRAELKLQGGIQRIRPFR